FLPLLPLLPLLPHLLHRLLSTRILKLLRRTRRKAKSETTKKKTTTMRQVAGVAAEEGVTASLAHSELEDDGDDLRRDLRWPASSTSGLKFLARRLLVVLFCCACAISKTSHK